MEIDERVIPIQRLSKDGFSDGVVTLAAIDQYSEQLQSGFCGGMKKPGLILIGAGGHARACIDVIEQQGQFNIVGLVGLPEELHSQRLGYEVIGTDEELAQLAKTTKYALITTGQIQTAKLRMHLYQLATSCSLQMPAIISPNAHVSRHALVGAGSIVMHGAVVNAGTKVGKNCIINTRTLLEHDITIGDHCHISTGAILNGGVNVGAGSFIGSGCVVKEGISIGNNCLVGIGLTVRQTLSDSSHITNQV